MNDVSRSFRGNSNAARDIAHHLHPYTNFKKHEQTGPITIVRGRGVTVAAASLTGLPNNHRSFDLPIAGILHTTTPHYYRGAKDGESEEQFATRCAHELEELIVKEGGAEQVAAMICEPVMGAGGVIVPP